MAVLAAKIKDMMFTFEDLVKIDSKGAKFVLTTAGGKQYLVNRKASDNGQRVLTDLQGKNISPNGGIFKGSVEDAAAYVATLD